MRKTLDVSITISGLCLVELNGTDSSRREARELVVSMPGQDDRHEARLSFTRDAVRFRPALFERFRSQKRQLDRFFGPSGVDLYSLELGEGRGYFKVSGKNPKPPSSVMMDWGPPTIRGRAPTADSPLRIAHGLAHFVDRSRARRLGIRILTNSGHPSRGLLEGQKPDSEQGTRLRTLELWQSAGQEGHRRRYGADTPMPKTQVHLG